MKARTLPILAIAALALSACSNNGNEDSQGKSSAPTTYDAPSDAYDDVGTGMPSQTPTQDTEPFTLDDTMQFTGEKGSTGTITFNASPPQDLALGLQWAGKPAGSWASIHVDNRKGADAVPFSNLGPTLLDDAGTKYELRPDSDVAANLYGDSDSEDSHQDAYYDLYDKYNTGNGEVAAGEVKDMLLYSSKPLPQKLARGTIGIDATETPLVISK
ncbi:hypothetical protein [Kocuria sp. TGY1127_2]|uniref:hypothetical protein n=1 Tax=Kocuria sp. TGY1127_2 TaxID=2711328 RepID=UPI0015BE9F93|nr:hypothetical protein [Kocuria sp. TGY1127_2]